MMIIKKYEDGTFLEYDRGSFDEWCVYYNNPKTGYKKSPRDKEYFSFLKDLSFKYGKEKVYEDFVLLYDITNKSLDKNVLGFIEKIAKTYNRDALAVDKVFTILYMAMIS